MLLSLVRRCWLCDQTCSLFDTQSGRTGWYRLWAVKGEHTKFYSRINKKSRTIVWPVVLLKGISKKSNLHKVNKSPFFLFQRKRKVGLEHRHCDHHKVNYGPRYKKTASFRRTSIMCRFQKKWGVEGNKGGRISNVVKQTIIILNCT